MTMLPKGIPAIHEDTLGMVTMEMPGQEVQAEEGCPRSRKGRDRVQIRAGNSGRCETSLICAGDLPMVPLVSLVTSE